MSLASLASAPARIAAKVFNPLQPLFALAARFYVSWQFLKAGYLKYMNWDSTVALFDTRYHVPYLSAHDAAVAATFGELFFPTLLVLGLFSRLGAVGLAVVNVVAVISYSNVLLADASQAALAQHVLWGVLLLFLIVYGPSSLSLDQLFNRSRVVARPR